MVESTADVPLPDDLGMPCDGRRADAYHFLHRAHRTDGRPFAVGEVYIAADVFAREPEAFRHGASVPVLDRFPGLRSMPRGSGCRSCRPVPNPPARWNWPWGARGRTAPFCLRRRRDRLLRADRIPDRVCLPGFRSARPHS
jgi:hypothetical protein